MAFMDKFTSMAKNAADKTNDLIGIGKLNLKINEEREKISAAKLKIGEYYWNQFVNNAVLDSEPMDFCSQILVATTAIESCQNEIRVLKQEKPAATAEQPFIIGSVPCPSCGSMVEDGKKFCPQCGFNMASSVAPQEEPMDLQTCSGCGKLIKADLKFCPECGKQLL
ncbi:MAG: zinc ribbon domain-containing protein [Clostridia bacterium]